MVDRLLAAGAAVDHTVKDGRTPLINAAQRGCVAMVDRLLAAGASVDKTSKDGTTPLFIAAAYKHLAVVRQLLAAGAVVDTAASYGTLSIIAGMFDHRATVAVIGEEHRWHRRRTLLMCLVRCSATDRPDEAGRPRTQIGSSGADRPLALLRLAELSPSLWRGILQYL